MRRPVVIPVLALAAAVAVVAPSGPATAAGRGIALRAAGSMTVTASGNGHGHGLSQYGANGAALAGLSAARILAHYYPGTTLTTLPASSPKLRVKIGGAGPATRVFAQPGLTVTGVSGTLPTAGVRRYRLIAGTGTALTLQRLSTTAGTPYKTIRTGLPNGAQFSAPGGRPIRLLLADGTSTYYYGALRAVRLSARGGRAGVATVDVVDYDHYVAGVVPREMPASWPAAALAAQAVAARTYAVYEQRHAGSSYYDICDSSNCQVYGGYEHLASNFAVLTTDYPAAATATSRSVLTYRGTPIFAQYSASNGGAMVAGGQPYLRAGVDPYDPGRSGDPYIGDRSTVAVRALAAYYGLAKVTSLAITRRDGVGSWGGRVVSATVYGTTSAGRATAVTTDGANLSWALGLGTTLFTVTAGR